MFKDSLRIPMSWDQNARDLFFTKDTLRVNVMDEPADGVVYTIKRPGFSAYTTLSAGTGQGLTWYNGIVYAINGDVFSAASAVPNSGTNGSAWTVLGASAPWKVRFKFLSLVFNNQVFIMGNTTAANANGDVWATQDMVNWTQVTGAAPFGSRQGLAGCVFNGRMYVSGGYGNVTGGSQQDVWSSDDGANWTLEIENCPWLPRSGHAMLATASGMFVLGGTRVETGLFYNDVWFSADGKTWTIVTAAAAWAVRANFGACVYNNLLCVAGGAQPALQNDFYTSPDGASWTLQSAAAWGASGRSGPTLTVYGGKIYAIGGVNGTPVVTSDVYTSTGTGAFTFVGASLAVAKAFHCTVVFNTPISTSTYRYPTLWALGGEDASFGLVATVESANLNAAISSSTALAPTTANQPYQFASYRTGTQLVFKNQSDMWVLAEGVIQKMTNTTYPKITVPGIVVLGGQAYVMDPSGLIWNSDLDNIFGWQSVNVLGADYEDDQGVCLAKYLNYVVAYGVYTTQVFYDAGLSPGSPLQPYLNANSKIGCASAASVVEMGTTLCWVAQSKEKHRQVVYFEGLNPTPISTPYIEKWLNANTSFSAWKVTTNGQLFYVVNCQPADVSWAYSFTTKKWYLWLNATNGVRFPGQATDLVTGTQYFQMPSGGQIVFADDTVYGDSGVAFQVVLVTQKIDCGTKRKKFWGRLDIIADQNIGLPLISYSDDDYQTWSTPRTVDMSTTRPALFRNGSSYRRAFKYDQTDLNAMRLECFEQTYEHEGLGPSFG